MPTLGKITKRGRCRLEKLTAHLESKRLFHNVAYLLFYPNVQYGDMRSFERTARCATVTRHFRRVLERLEAHK